MIKFSIAITTKNRRKDLAITLQSLVAYTQNPEVELLICDDASTDGTADFLQKNYANHTLIFNKKSKGLIANRNKLNNLAKGKYIISLDDDAQFLSSNVLDEIENCFLKYPSCGVQALRVFWGQEKPISTKSSHQMQQVKGFVGCGHVWRKNAWIEQPNYPDWFVFYGEEDFAAYQLLKHQWKVIYNPTVLVHHRVNVKARKQHKDYRLRLRRSLRSGWYLYILFYPIKEIPKRFLYTLFIQIKKKMFKGDGKATVAIAQALLDVVWHMPKLINNNNRLTVQEFNEYQQLPDTPIYWDLK